jgi:hypothetical protein
MKQKGENLKYLEVRSISLKKLIFMWHFALFVLAIGWPITSPSFCVTWLQGRQALHVARTRPAGVCPCEGSEMLGSKRTALRAIGFCLMHHTPWADIQISRLNTCIIIITTTTTTIVTMQVEQPEYN